MYNPSQIFSRDKWYRSPQVLLQIGSNTTMLGTPIIISTYTLSPEHLNLSLAAYLSYTPNWLEPTPKYLGLHTVWYCILWLGAMP
jgi:hypothetical protein